MACMDAGSLRIVYQWSCRGLFNYIAPSIALTTLKLFSEKEYVELLH